MFICVFLSLFSDSFSSNHPHLPTRLMWTTIMFSTSVGCFVLFNMHTFCIWSQQDAIFLKEALFHSPTVLFHITVGFPSFVWLESSFICGTTGKLALNSRVWKCPCMHTMLKKKTFEITVQSRQIHAFIKHPVAPLHIQESDSSFRSPPKMLCKQKEITH